MKYHKSSPSKSAFQHKLFLLLALLVIVASQPGPASGLDLPGQRRSRGGLFPDGSGATPDEFVIKLTDPAKIQHARNILNGKEKDLIRVKGRIIKQGVAWNPPWSFHYDPDSIGFFAVAIEVCDASIGYVESFLAEAGGAFLPGNVWCPFSSRLLKEIPPPSGVNGLTSISAASYKRVGLAPESIVTAYGQGLALTTEAATSLPLPEQLGGTTVKIKDSAGIERLAPLFFVSPVQVNYLIPKGTTPGMATVTVTNLNNVAVTEWTQVLNLAPGLFTANSDGWGPPAGFAVRLKADGSQRFEPLAMTPQPKNSFRSSLNSGRRVSSSFWRSLAQACASPA